ncbi:MAG: ABC transporter permease [Gemmatimonadetes bacterium]|nr:ABC transporter permease [Gemmatimonadota bacterium]
MKLARNIHLSCRALLRHRTRTMLAVAGSAIGVGTVLVMIAVGYGAESAIEARIDALGRRMLVINAADAPRPIARARTARKVTTLRLADVTPLLERSPSITLAAPSRDQARRVKAGIISMIATIRATTPEWAEIRNFRLTAGRFFTHDENASLARVGVLGSNIRETLFPDTDPIGRIVAVGRVPIRVIGVLRSKGVTIDGLSNEDDQIVVPLNTGMRRIFNVDELNMIFVRVAEHARPESAITELRSVLRDRHRLDVLGRADDFTIQDQAILLEAERASNAAFQEMILGLGAIAFALGGTGILAIMLQSVKERTLEIGLRMAVGARRRDVLRQFFIESLALGTAGAALGTGAGIAVAAILGRTTEWSTRVAWPSVALASGAAIAIGLFAGVLPARRAAAIDPIRALHSG